MVTTASDRFKGAFAAIRLSGTSYDCLLCQLNHKCTTVFDFWHVMYSVINTVAGLTTDLLFLRHCLSTVFQTLHGYNLAWCLQIHTRCDDLDLVSRSLVCQEM